MDHRIMHLYVAVFFGLDFHNGIFRTDDEESSHCTGYWVQQQESFHPSPSDVEIYNEMYDVYKESYTGVKHVFEKLSTLRTTLVSSI
jgi:hypothetical protein